MRYSPRALGFWSSAVVTLLHKTQVGHFLQRDPLWGVIHVSFRLGLSGAQLEPLSFVALSEGRQRI